MANWKNKLEQHIRAIGLAPGAIYLAGTDEDALREAEVCALRLLKDLGAEEPTLFEGPAPDLGGLVAAAGTISFFGTPRTVLLRGLSPSALSDKDAKELAELFGEAENAVLLVCCLYKDKKTAASKKAKLLFDAAGAAGLALTVEKPTAADNIAYLEETAAGLGARYAPGAARLLLERAGDSRPLLKSETEKLAAICGYGEINAAYVAAYGVHNIEADVFELVRLITAGNLAAAFAKLQELLQLRHEPVAICGALAGSHVDMYRVRCADEAKIPLATLFQDMGYKGNDYRLQRSRQSAAKFSTSALENCILWLSQLDIQLKSSAVQDKAMLLEATIARLATVGKA